MSRSLPSNDHPAMHRLPSIKDLVPGEKKSDGSSHPNGKPISSSSSASQFPSVSHPQQFSQSNSWSVDVSPHQSAVGQYPNHHPQHMKSASSSSTSSNGTHPAIRMYDSSSAPNMHPAYSSEQAINEDRSRKRQRVIDGSDKRISQPGMYVPTQYAYEEMSRPYQPMPPSPEQQTRSNIPQKSYTYPHTSRSQYQPRDAYLPTQQPPYNDGSRSAGYEPYPYNSYPTYAQEAAYMSSMAPGVPYSQQGPYVQVQQRPSSQVQPQYQQQQQSPQSSWNSSQQQHVSRGSYALAPSPQIVTSGYSQAYTSSPQSYTPSQMMPLPQQQQQQHQQQQQQHHHHHPDSPASTHRTHSVPPSPESSQMMRQVSTSPQGPVVRKSMTLDSHHPARQQSPLHQASTPSQPPPAPARYAPKLTAVAPATPAELNQKMREIVSQCRELYRLADEPDTNQDALAAEIKQKTMDLIDRLQHFRQRKFPDKPPPSSAEGKEGASDYRRPADRRSDYVKKMSEEEIRHADDALSEIRRKRHAMGANVTEPNKAKYKKRSSAQRAVPPGECQACGSKQTPEWRRGPGGPRTLCNACGLHYAKLERKRNRQVASNPGVEIPPTDLNAVRESTRLPDPIHSEKARQAMARAEQAQYAAPHSPNRHKAFKRSIDGIPKEYMAKRDGEQQQQQHQPPLPHPHWDERLPQRSHTMPVQPVAHIPPPAAPHPSGMKAAVWPSH